MPLDSISVEVVQDSEADLEKRIGLIILWKYLVTQWQWWWWISDGRQTSGWGGFSPAARLSGWGKSALGGNKVSLETTSSTLWFDKKNYLLKYIKVHWEYSPSCVRPVGALAEADWLGVPVVPRHNLVRVVHLAAWDQVLFSDRFSQSQYFQSARDKRC